MADSDRAPDRELGTRLARGLGELQLALDDEQVNRLLAYVDLLARWNRHFNLTAVRDPRDMITRHLLDSLAILPILKSGRYLDVGSGAGLPGIPLAIARPDWPFTLLDSNGKKTRFLFQAASELGLRNVEVVRARLPDWVPDQPFPVVLSRAFASLVDIVDTCAHLLSPSGTLLAMKGAPGDDELQSVQRYAELISVTPIAVPQLDEERCLVALRPRQVRPS